MTGDGPGPALVGAAVVLALLVIRTAVRELREPGSARVEWRFLRDRRGVTVFLATAAPLSAASWTAAGPAHLPWTVLAALLVARVTYRAD